MLEKEKEGREEGLLIRLNNISVQYGYIKALTGVSLVVKEEEVVTILGGNGAGKTSILKAISGLIKVVDGEIWYDSHKINNLEPTKIVSLGIAHVPEGRKLFSDMSVVENLLMGAFKRKDKKEVKETLEFVFERFPRLKERMHQVAGKMSGGEQQMLALGRALMSKPKLLLLDEPTLGLSPLIVRETANIISDIIVQGFAVILVEQNARMAFKIASFAYILENGKIVIEGTSEKLSHDDMVRRVYLGL
jgi:branched-chain amino acid transport system ATP-binding protein